MQPAKRTTKPLDSRAFPIPAVRSWTNSRATAIPAPTAFRAIAPTDGSLDFSFSGLKTSVRYFLESDAGRDAGRPTSQHPFKPP